MIIYILPLFPDIKRKLFKIEFHLLHMFKENIFEKGDKNNEKTKRFFFKSQFPSQNEVQILFSQKKKIIYILQRHK